MSRNPRGRRSQLNIINKKVLLIVGIAIIALLCIFLMIKFMVAKKHNKDETSTNPNLEILFEEINKEADKLKKQEDTNINIEIIGSIFCEEKLLNSVYNSEQDNYIFYRNFHKIIDKTSTADLCIGVLETNFADSPYSSKGKHNAPTSLAETLSLIGIDVLSTATNYSFDYGIEGIISTKDILEKHKIETVGTNRTPEEKDNILIKEINGIKLAFLSYTYGINFEVSEEYKYSVNIINKNNMKEDIDKAKNNGADFIFLNLHCGSLKSSDANDEQKDLVNYAIKCGVDVIIGSHPIEIQNMEMRENSNQKNVFVAYAMGNFLSSDDYENAKIGLIVNIQITKSSETDETYISKITYTPSYINYNKVMGSYEVLDVRKEVEKYEANDEDKVDENIYKMLKEKLEMVDNKIGGNK